MKPILKFAAYIFLSWIVIFTSCKKEYSCETCGVNPSGSTNKPPIANAGPDQTIMLPMDSVSLDGSASSDPDGTISSFQWSKISGPASFIINNAATARTVIKNLAAGVYRFELKVTDNGGLSSKDTMRVIVNDPAQPNRPPVANAGPDQTIALPTNTINLDGSGSTDPDNNITSYAWSKISGPSSFNISNANTVQTQVSNLVQGIYQFELKVTDAGSLFSKDTMQVTVNPEPPPPPPTCDPGNRPLINAQLVPVGTLSQTRVWGVVLAAAGNKILFAGGLLPGNSPATNRVDIYDIVTGVWTTAQLSQARYEIGVAVLGNKIFFGGGIVPDQTGGVANNINDRSSAIDIYDVSTNIWSTAQLGRARCPVGASVANKIFFAGGEANFPVFNNHAFESYDAGSNLWSTSLLNNAFFSRKPAVVGNKIFYAGGYDDGIIGNYPETWTDKRIYIYDASSNIWSTDSLSIERADMGTIAANNKIYWGGGWVDGPPGGSQWVATNSVEIRDLATNTTSFDCLSEAKSGLTAVRKDNKIIFYGGNNARFDIFDLTTNSWSIGVLPQNLLWSSIISYNNILYVTDGNQVWKLEF